MANIKPEDGEHSIWQGYSHQAPSVSHPPAFDSNYHSPALSIPYHGRPQKGTYRSLDIPSIHPRPPPREGSGVMTASPPPLNTHHSYPSLKRTFQGEIPYGESVQEFKDEIDAPKPTISQDHRLLSFGKLQDKHTIIDGQGRVQQIELTAQIHGMFFLSELATPAGENHLVQPELTCYRRNLFQISGSVTTPRSALSIVTEHNNRIPIVSLEVVISATESVDNHIVKLIVIPWKTPPPNSPEIPTGQEHEPAPIPLLPFDEGPDADPDFTVYPIAYRRLQFRIATANNGRRRELQQHFTLHLNVVGTLANGTKLKVCETTTAPIVVRGRSPRNFQARKEIPLVGSSSSRGQPPELQVATNIMPNTGGHDGKKTAKPQTLELPRSPFTFDSSTISGSPSMIRQTYSSWNATHTTDHTTAPNTPNYPAPSIGIDNYLQVNQSDPNLAHDTPSTIRLPPPPSSEPPSSTTLRFIDSNPRPAKSPRHVAPPEVPSNAPQAYSEYSTRFAAPYSQAPSVAMRSRAPEYFPTTQQHSMTMNQPWTSASEVGGVYGTSQPPSVHQYEFPTEQSQYVKQEGEAPHPPMHYTWNLQQQ
ncbi:hypothetical protein BGZ57DRAFT_943380 [Hyaloscypha finlandica]|nr:hypothetical protein BGZ57DRAFT_943380 [Hyaloscypha finlandica]